VSLQHFNSALLHGTSIIDDIPDSGHLLILMMKIIIITVTVTTTAAANTNISEACDV